MGDDSEKLRDEISAELWYVLGQGKDDKATIERLTNYILSKLEAKEGKAGRALDRKSRKNNRDI